MKHHYKQKEQQKMYNKKTLYVVAVICAMMLVSTGFVSASETKTPIKFSVDKETLLNRIQKVAGNNNTTMNTKLITLLILGALLGGATLVWLFALKHRRKVLLAYCSGLQTALVIDIALVLLFNKKEPQNETNSTL
jgi:hypothetical protein